MSYPLKDLINQAENFMAFDCTAGKHDWVAVGGRACPREDEEDPLAYLLSNPAYRECSQTVYECKRCGMMDYGESNGPGHQECFSRHDRCRDRF